MLNKIIIITVLLISSYAGAAEQLSPEERMKLEYYVLKVKEINFAISELETRRMPYIKSYQDYYAELMKVYNKDAKDFNISLETGKFVKVDYDTPVESKNDNKKTK